MVNLTFMLADTIEWATGFWGSIIGFFNSGIASYAWAIVLVTLVVKLVLSPVDFLQRRAGAKQAIIQAKHAPVLNKIRQKYANDPQLMQQKLQEKQMELMKNGEMKMGGTCAIMALQLILTLVVFLSLFYSMMDIANIRTVNNYIEFENEYQHVLDNGGSTEDAQQAVLDLYNSGEVTEGWLWVKNIWKPDTATSIMPSFEEFKSTASGVSGSPYTFEGEGALTEEKYNTVMAKITESTQGTWNGYYILILLCGAVSFLSMHFATGKGSNANAAATGGMAGGGFAKILKFAMPVIMVLITLFYSTAFALYIFANSLFTLCVTPLYNFILKKTVKVDNTSNGAGGSNTDGEMEVSYRINKITKIDE